MNYETTKQVLEKLKPYIDTEQINILTENTDWKGKKYNSDLVKLDEKHDVSFEVTERSIIVFYFTDHEHFDNFTSEEDDVEYIDWAIEFLINLFTLPIRHVEKYKGKKLSSEKYYFINNDFEECTSGIISYGCVRLINPFAKRSYKSETWKYDAEAKMFVNDAIITK